MRFPRFKKTALALVLGAGLTSGAQAGPLTDAVVTAVNDTFTVTWLYDVFGTSATDDDLSATATFTVTGFTSSLLTLEIEIENTTQVSGGTAPDDWDYGNAAITAFGFYIDPDATSVSPTNDGSGPSWNAALDGNLTGNFKAVDVCVFTQNCNGGNVNLGLQAGDTDIVTLLLAGNWSDGNGGLMATFPAISVECETPGNSAASNAPVQCTDEANFGIKFQTGEGSYEFPGSSTTTTTTTTTSGSTSGGSVPEPGSPLALIGLGLALWVLTPMRRRARIA